MSEDITDAIFTKFSDDMSSYTYFAPKYLPLLHKWIFVNSTTQAMA